MIIYFIAVISLLAAVCLAAVVAQKSRKFDYAEYVMGGDGATNIKQLALAMKDVEKVGAAPDVSSLLRKIMRAYNVVCAKVRRGEEIYEFEKWLYENYRSVTLGIDKNAYKNFATLPHRGEARVIHLAFTVTSQTYCKIDARTVSEAVREFCRYTPLTYGEIRALKGAFEIALLKKTAFVADKIRALEKVRKRAEEDREPDVRYGKKEGYLYYYKATGKSITEKFLSKNTEINVENLDFAFAGAAADYTRIVSNAVASLKNLNEVMNDCFVTSLSPIDGLFGRDKSYRDSDCASKNLYLSAVARLASYFNASEYAVAKGALDLAVRFDKHFGEILFDYRYNLRAHLKGRQTSELRKTSYASDKAAYYLSIFLLQCAFSVISGIFLPGIALKIAVTLATFIACYPPCEYIAERVIAFFLPKRPVPRLNYKNIPVEGATAVVVSHYLTDEIAAEKAARDILALQAVNRYDNVKYFLLCDLRESAYETDGNDDRIIDTLKKYSQSGGFTALVRKRVKSGKRYVAYERKRGAIMDFNEFLLSGDSEKFRYVSDESGFDAKFVMVLDADSRLYPGEVITAVNTVLHPLNRKYDLMTFDCEYSLSSLKTRYSRRFLDNSGAQVYGNYDDFYFNLCNRAIFCGKGIYDLETFHEKTSAAIPDGKVLSHDILEGALTNTGSLGLATWEDAPLTFVSDAARKRRWERGDFLLLPFAGKKYRTDGIYGYVIMKNAFSYFAPAAALALWILAFSFAYPMQMLGLFFATFSGAVASLAMTFYSATSVSKKELLRRVISTVGDAVSDVVLLPFYAVGNIAVAAGTFFDYVFNSRSLLRWQPFAQAQKAGDFASHAAAVAPSCIAVCILAAALYSNIAVAVYAGVFILFANALYFSGKISEKRFCDGQIQATLKEFAVSTAAYFGELSGDDLPCDNIQIHPPKGKSATTSPTNLGYTLLSYVCAAELGIISVCRAHAAMSGLTEKCEALEKWKGHLYNWYDVATKKPVNPLFVSSADSGNFVAALIVCEGFCRKNGFSYTAARCRKLIDETDFSALTDPDRNLLYIGYNYGAGRYEGHYDLLASEARLAAYIACCKAGDPSVWNSMSRVQVNSRGSVLASWSGTAFEYLMPQLFLPETGNSLITASAQRAVRTFMSRKCNSLWGISESGYYAFDENSNYQYKAHGLSDLALSGADDRCIVTPYASAIALGFAPKEATENLKRLRACGGYGDYGFYEAIDYTAGKNTVASYMTHHQGMIFCALANALCDDVIKKYFFEDDAMRGGALMLEEKEDCSAVSKTKKRDFVYDAKKNDFSYETELSEFPETCLLYGREYAVVIDDYGCGYSRWRDKTVNAFSHNHYKNSGGFGYFLCDGEVFSPTFAPLKRDGGAYKARFSRSAAEFSNVKSDCFLKVYAPTVISGEVREYTVVNDSDRLKNYSFVFAERIAMAGERDYASHPAFCDLFVGARFDREKKTVYLTRRPRDFSSGFSLAATLIADGEAFCECNRNNLYGRNRGDGDPLFCFGSNVFPSEGDVLAPCIGLKCNFSLAPGESKKVAVVIQCAEDERTLENRVAQVLGTDFLGYAEKSAGTDASAMRKYLSDPATAKYAGKLAAKLLYEPYSKAALLSRISDASPLAADVKTLVLKYDGNADFTKKAVKSAIACKLSGIDLRLVILYEERDVGRGETANEICLRSTVSDLRELGFVKFADVNAFKPKEIKNLTSSCFLVMKELKEEKSGRIQIAVRRKNGDAAFTDCVRPPVFGCGNGGFDENGDYVVVSTPQAPYSNVVCHKLGGFVATENGGGFCYFLNSQSDKLSGWSNDPVTDAPYERLLVSDGSSVIRLNKLNKGGYVRHGKGFSEYRSRTAKADYSLRKTATLDGRVNALLLDVKNLSDKNLTLDVTYLIEPCLDSFENRDDVFCEKVGGDAVRAYNVRTGRTFYLIAKGGAELITDCAQALSRGINGFNPKRCESVFNNPLSGATVRTEVKKNSRAVVEFALCDGEESLDFARNADLSAECLKSEYTLRSANKTKIRTSDKALDLLLANLPYQVVSSRLNGKCGYYQAGGATGFRDQLQDCLALLWSDPERVREHILTCAERQYIEGDVMHWWHSPAFGVRTRITDDRLFLAYVTFEYIAATGDESILGEKCDYLIGAPLDDLQEARLEHGRYAGARETLLLHLQRAIDSLSSEGEHGLLLIGGGDWNDALNGIGTRGRGESVWLTQFAVDVIEKFCAFIDPESAKRYARKAAKLRKALENAFFDGRWARAFTDDGEWLGTKKSKACKTDLICQSWAQIICSGSEEQRASAMKAASSLTDREAGAIKLFSPPFDGKGNYGYISSYPQGVRENGGQYTHAAAWYLLACCRAGDKKRANEVLRMLNPAARCCDKEKNDAYKGEPYVLAGDVYTNKDNYGRAGWTWYTGSAAWLYKVVLEEMLGVKKRGETLEFSEPLLEEADKAVLEYEYKGTQYVIAFRKEGVRGMRMNGVNYTNCSVLALKENRGVVKVEILF